MNKYKYIVYLMQNFPGQQSFDLFPARSIKHAKELYVDFCESVGNDDSSAFLYPWTPENWRDAVEFGEDGCPFDYPSLLIERGPRGGVAVNET